MRFPKRYRHLLFAFLMSATTAAIVSGLITFLHRPANLEGLKVWLQSFLLAWPIVFLVILVIAPLISRLTDCLVQE